MYFTGKNCPISMNIYKHAYAYVFVFVLMNLFVIEKCFTVVVVVVLLKDTWRCSQCTFINERQSSKCSACGAYNGKYFYITIILDSACMLCFQVITDVDFKDDS